jgi:hypothetical protein
MDEAAADPMEESLNDLAERLCAAAVSHQLGNRSVDYTLKADIRGRGCVVGEYWQALARQVHAHMLASRERRASGARLSPNSV